MQVKGRVAVLGAGIMGASLALFLARRGFAVHLFDQEDAPLSCASRWNEGKIHLGYLYGADDTLQTARRVLPGGLVFGQLLAELVETDISPYITQQDDIYLVHRQSVVDFEKLKATFDAISALIRAHNNANRYLTDVSSAQAVPLRPKDIEMLADSRLVAGAFRIPERSVNTQPIADLFCAALASESQITLRLGTKVTEAQPVASKSGPWRLKGSSKLNEEFSIVLNALWNGRLAIDCGAGLKPETGWTHRYRRCLFVKTRYVLRVPNAIIAVGPFGDVKNYDGYHYYLSWYPVGLALQSDAISPHLPSPLTTAATQRLIYDMRAGLENVMPSIALIFEAAESIDVRGGYVFAVGEGPLDNPESGLHRRDQFGVRRFGSYFSIDTGKYSTAPWLAKELVREICGE